MFSVRLPVRTFQILAKQTKFQAKTMFTTGETVGLAEWIIDETCLVPPYFTIQTMSYLIKVAKLLQKHQMSMNIYYFLPNFDIIEPCAHL